MSREKCSGEQWISVYLTGRRQWEAARRPEKGICSLNPTRSEAKLLPKARVVILEAINRLLSLVTLKSGNLGIARGKELHVGDL